MGGAVVQWIVEGLKLADSPAAAQALAESVPDTNGVVFVPALTGLGAPEWDPLARGAIFGLTRGATDAHVARAAMEAIPLQVGDLMVAMMSRLRPRTPRPARRRRRDRQRARHADARRRARASTSHVRAMAESTALGAAYLAGLAVGVWSGPEDLPMLRASASTYEPRSVGCACALPTCASLGRGGQALAQVGAGVAEGQVGRTPTPRSHRA